LLLAEAAWSIKRVVVSTVVSKFPARGAGHR